MKTLLSAILVLIHGMVNAAVTLKPSGGSVEAMAIGRPAFLKVNGKGGPPKGEIKVNADKFDGRLEFDLSSLSTGIDLRDDHMRNKYLEVAKFPKAVLELQEQKLPKPWSNGGLDFSDAKFFGKLTLHGVTKPVEGRFSMNGGKAVTAKFAIKLSDFAIDIPKYAGITIADHVDVTVKIEGLTSAAN
jgi:polyisoprenoid-binding protein YceI